MTDLRGGPLNLSGDVALFFTAQLAVTCSKTNNEAHRNAKALEDILLRMTPKDKEDTALVARAVLRYVTQ